MGVGWEDKRYRKLVDWLANEHRVLAAALGRKPTVDEHRAHAHRFIDMVFDDDEQDRAAEARKVVVPLRPE